MYYKDGKKVKLGDLVDLGSGQKGEIVITFFDGNFSKEYPKVEWDIYKGGIMIESDELGLVYMEDTSWDLRLINRKDL